MKDCLLDENWLLVSLSKCTARLGHLEKGTSRLGTATGGNTQRHKPRADTFWGMLWAFGGWEFVGVVVGGWVRGGHPCHGIRV